MNISPQDFREKIYLKEHLPKGLTVMGNVSLSQYYLHVTHLPENLTIEGFLDLDGCTKLTHLPSGLVVKGWLDLLGCTSLTHLPPRLVVEKGLHLKGCKSLTNLPPDLKADIIYCNEKFIDTIPKEDLPLYLNFKFGKSAHEHLTSRLRK